MYVCMYVCMHVFLRVCLYCQDAMADSRILYTSMGRTLDSSRNHASLTQQRVCGELHLIVSYQIIAIEFPFP